MHISHGTFPIPLLFLEEIPITLQFLLFNVKASSLFSISFLCDDNHSRRQVVLSMKSISIRYRFQFLYFNSCEDFPNGLKFSISVLCYVVPFLALLEKWTSLNWKAETAFESFVETWPIHCHFRHLNISSVISDLYTDVVFH